MNHLQRPLVLGVLLVALGIVLPAAAQAKAPIYEFTQTTSSTQAGGHPDIDTVNPNGQQSDPGNPGAVMSVPGPEDRSPSTLPPVWSAFLAPCPSATRWTSPRHVPDRCTGGNIGGRNRLRHWIL